MKKIETANQKKSWKCFYAEYFGARSAVKLVKDQLNDGFFMLSNGVIRIRILSVACNIQMSPYDSK